MAVLTEQEFLDITSNGIPASEDDRADFIQKMKDIYATFTSGTSLTAMQLNAAVNQFTVLSEKIKSMTNGKIQILITDDVFVVTPDGDAGLKAAIGLDGPSNTALLAGKFSAPQDGEVFATENKAMMKADINEIEVNKTTGLIRIERGTKGKIEIDNVSARIQNTEVASSGQVEVKNKQVFLSTDSGMGVETQLFLTALVADLIAAAAGARVLIQGETAVMTLKKVGVNNIYNYLDVPEFANNAAALAGGLVAGDKFKTTVVGEATLKIVI